MHSLPIPLFKKFHFKKTHYNFDIFFTPNPDNSQYLTTWTQL